MRSAILVMLMIAAAAAEAPYNLPRPALHAPGFNYAQPAPPPAPAILPHLTPLPQLPYSNAPPAFHPNPAPLPGYQSTYNYPQPISHPHIQFQPQIQAIVRPQPQLSYYSPSQQTPIPLPVNYPRPQQAYQQPNIFYGQPQAPPPSIYTPQLPIELTRPLSPFAASQQQYPITYHQQQHQFSPGQGYPYPQTSTVPFISQLALQSQSLSNFPSLSSYQADSNQYNTAAQRQTHNEALDSTVVSRVQNIIKENEHTSAKEAGFLSLVSGVSLENAKPSLEISSFVQNSPSSFTDSSSFSSSSSSSSSAVSNPSASYDSPANTNSQSSSGASSLLSFLPLTQPASSYGSPN